MSSATDHLTKDASDTARERWLPWETAPQDGSKVEVMHEQCGEPSKICPAIASYADGRWCINQVFIHPRTMRMYSTPTHWRRAPAKP